MDSKKLFIIAGPTAVGKGTLVSALAERHRDIWVSISATTRSPRKTEINSKDYFFISKQKFEQHIKNNELLEYAIVHNNYYGTLKNKVAKKQHQGKIVILEIDFQGALQVKRKLGDLAVLIFIKPKSDKVLLERLEKRGTEGSDEVKIRLNTAKKEMEQIDKFDHVVINDKLEKALTDLERIIYNS